MFNSDLTANRPAAGIVGRIFIATDSPFGIFRDTGTGWDQISSAGGATIYTSNGTLTGNRTVSSGGFNLTFAPQTTFLSSLTAANGGSSYAVLGSNALTFAAGFSSSNIGNVYSANGAINLQSFSGSATFAQANLASAMVSVNSVDFTSAGSTITMTQSTGIRAMTGHQSRFQYQGTNSGTITHAAVSQNLGFYRPPAATGTLTITNAYGHLINALDDYGAGFTFTNRWGIYQSGASDKNYFAANVGIGIDAPSNNLDVNTTVSGGGILLKQNTVTIGEFTRVGNNNRSRINLLNSGITEITFDSGGTSFIRSNNLLLGSTVDNGQRLQVTGTANVTQTITSSNISIGTSNTLSGAVIGVQFNGILAGSSNSVTLSSGTLRGLYVGRFLTISAGGGSFDSSYIGTGVSAGSPVVVSTDSRFGVGYNSTLPTLQVSVATGGTTAGSVGIGQIGGNFQTAALAVEGSTSRTDIQNDKISPSSVATLTPLIRRFDDLANGSLAGRIVLGSQIQAGLVKTFVTGYNIGASTLNVNDPIGDGTLLPITIFEAIQGWATQSGAFAAAINYDGNLVVGDSPVNSSTASLQVNSTTKGFLPPRMTTAQINAIASPAEGLVIYNTTISHLCCYQAGAWAKFSHSPM
jgi:hypothetical protein